MYKIEKTSTIILIHSTVFYILSYLIILIFFQLITAISGQFFDLPALVRYNRLDFLVTTQAWTFDSIKLIFTSGVITALLLGLICLVIFIKASRFEGLLKIFFFWGFVHGLNMFIGSVVIGAFFYEGMGYVYAWMYVDDTLKMFLLFGGLVIMLGIGTWMVKPMLVSANIYYNTGRAENRREFKRYQFIYPYIISTIILILYRLPLSLYETFILITPGFFLLPLLSSFHQYTIFFFDEKERNNKLNIKVLIFTLVLMLIYRIILGYGLRIG
ncbi:MAG: hypothetical protein HXX13_01315 [Bacteroidetes bacterium]|nr:hypothetical protein [Bacteroidota bacterium]